MHAGAVTARRAVARLPARGPTMPGRVSRSWWCEARTDIEV